MTPKVVRCPDCGDVNEVPAAAKPGDLLECPNCAGHALRLNEEGGDWNATLAYRVSCPNCEQVVTVPEGTTAGDIVECCGRCYRLTFQYGAFAAKEP